MMDGQKGRMGRCGPVIEVVQSRTERKSEE